jgi:hypothetical protein
MVAILVATLHRNNINVPERIWAMDPYEMEKDDGSVDT